MQDQLSVMTETLKEEIKCELSPQSTLFAKDLTSRPSGRVQDGRYTPSPRLTQRFEWDQQGS